MQQTLDLPVTPDSALTEGRYTERIGWLRAAVLGAYDGTLSTASLVVGVAAASPDRQRVLIAGLAGLVAGAMSMAAGEYVSVSSQADAAKADLSRKQGSLDSAALLSRDELIRFYEQEGMEPGLAQQLADHQLTQNRLQAQVRDELGRSGLQNIAHPLHAAIASALTFAAGALLPLLIAVLSPFNLTIWLVMIGSLLSLALFGALAARIGGTPLIPSILRVVAWGALAMLATALVGRLFHVSV